jgi:hypothetical protein
VERCLVKESWEFPIRPLVWQSHIQAFLPLFLIISNRTVYAYIRFLRNSNPRVKPEIPFDGDLQISFRCYPSWSFFISILYITYIYTRGCSYCTVRVCVNTYTAILWKYTVHVILQFSVFMCQQVLGSLTCWDTQLCHTLQPLQSIWCYTCAFS